MDHLLKRIKGQDGYLNFANQTTSAPMLDGGDDGLGPYLSTPPTRAGNKSNQKNFGPLSAGASIGSMWVTFVKGNLRLFEVVGSSDSHPCSAAFASRSGGRLHPGDICLRVDVREIALATPVNIYERTTAEQRVAAQAESESAGMCGYKVFKSNGDMAHTSFFRIGGALADLIERLVLGALGDQSHESLSAANDAVNVADPLYEAVRREVEVRRHQQALRKAIDPLWGYACPLTGATAREQLEAAHLRGRDWRHHNGAGDGILLRRDLHASYDAGRFEIVPAGNLKARVVVTDPHKDIDQYHNREFLCPQAVYRTIAKAASR